METSTLQVLSEWWLTLDYSYLDQQSKTECAKENERDLQKGCCVERWQQFRPDGWNQERLLSGDGIGAGPLGWTGSQQVILSLWNDSTGWRSSVSEEAKGRVVRHASWTSGTAKYGEGGGKQNKVEAFFFSPWKKRNQWVQQ